MEINKAIEVISNDMECEDRPSILEAWQTLKSAVLAQQTNNTGSPKLPTLEECYQEVNNNRPTIGVWTQSDAIKCVYDYICRQRRLCVNRW